MSSTSLPVCNSTVNGVPHYSPPETLSAAANIAGATSAMTVSGCSTSFFLILLVVAYSSRGHKDAMTIIMAIIFLSCCSALINNYVKTQNETKRIKSLVTPLCQPESSSSGSGSSGTGSGSGSGSGTGGAGSGSSGAGSGSSGTGSGSTTSS